MAVKSNAYWEPVRSAAASDLDSFYLPIGEPLQNPIRHIGLHNTTNDIILFSFNGTDTHVILSTETSRFIDVCENRSETSGDLSIKKNTQIYVQSVNQSTGSVYIDAMYID